MARNIWNWQQIEWPHFSYNEDALNDLELKFSKNTGTVLGTFKHVNENAKEQLIIEILSNEALKTSEIEGEYLDRDSIQSSIKKNLGLKVDKKRIAPAEFGISEMMVDLHKNFNKQLTQQQLFNWHKMLTNGRQDLTDIGTYRTHVDPMQVVSGRLDKPTVHFEAPPSKNMRVAMKQFISWFNTSNSKTGKNVLPLAKAGITHLYFVCIHPFEDGNGRIARALTEKSIAQSIGQPALISLSKTIERNKKAYYNALENNNKDLEITEWLLYFGQTILDAQEDTLKLIDFLIEKAKFFDRYNTLMNERQLKVVTRIFDAGHQGFDGGLSADNYTKIAKTSASTATRDLKDMVDKKIFVKTGELKSTRYWLNIKH
ncbi:MAG: Fic family protein [Algibacter sp.]|uniref:Fic family protein n=1 Tax=Algibacter sp. TaxID=1872428 RepID=UPI002633B5E9|nr:Fic family protein [Algibacter sp.]MDG1729182.1 Fic family protein [Algibacter sp.]MDG2178439.1 Fic family protein [Algibacter sp.]